MQVGKWGTGVDTAITTMVCPDFFETDVTYRHEMGQQMYFDDQRLGKILHRHV